MSSLVVRILITPIRWYQRLISPMRPRTCRFHPTCSAYAVTALEIHGPFVGTWLAMRRLGRCHPWTPGGVDQVPPRGQWRSVRPPYDPRAGHGGGDSPDDGDGSDAATNETATRSRAPIGRPSFLIPATALRSPATRRDAVRPALLRRYLALTFITTMRRQGA